MKTSVTGSAASDRAVCASPHAHGSASVGQTMVRVQMALVPATLYGFWLYGWISVLVFALTVASCVVFEAMCLKLMGQGRVQRTLHDGSAILTGWLLAMTLPPWAPWWVAVLGGFIAIVIGKQVFGGLGQNVFNPAMVARVALLVSFPLPLTQWLSPLPLTSTSVPDLVYGLQVFLGNQPIPDGMASASLLGHVKTELSRGSDVVSALGAGNGLFSWAGTRSGSLGESSAWLILAGGLYLIMARVITWHIPAAVLAGIALPAAMAHAMDPAHYLSAPVHLLSGAAMLGAFFIATDYVTSPNTVAGQMVFGVGVGVLTWVIRTYGGYPEGMAFAVLLMNALTPIIDRGFKPRILGRDRSGKPLDIPSA